MNINLHIEQLTLDGFSIEAQQKAALITAVTAELQRLLGENGVGFATQSSNNLRAISGGLVNLKNNQNTTNLGNEIGAAIYQGIGQ